MSTRLVGPLLVGLRPRRLLGGWLLLVLFLQSACATGVPLSGGRLGSGSRHRSLAPRLLPKERLALTPEPGLEAARVYAVGFLEPSGVSTRPVPIARAEFQQAVLRLSGDVRLGKSPREAARELLNALPPPEVEHLGMSGWWLLEGYRDQTYTLVPLSQTGPVPLTPEADEALRAKYLQWCEGRGGGDCQGLLEDGLYLRTDDRRALALALSFGSVLDETREALARELLDVRALVSLVVWTVALYRMMWLVPEPVTKAVAASLTLILVGWLGLSTVYGLMDGWARMAEAAHRASTFEELREAGEAFGKVLGQDAARAMILAVATLSGHTLGQVASRVKSLPGYSLAGAQWEAQGGASALAPEVAVESALAREGALARAVAAVDTVATSPQGPLAVVLLKQGPGGGAGAAPGGA